MFCCIVLVFQKQGGNKKEWLSLFFERIKTSQLIFQQAKDWRSFFSLPMISIVAIRWILYTADDISVVSAASVSKLAFGFWKASNNDFLDILLLGQVARPNRYWKGCKLETTNKEVRKRERQNWYIKIYVKTFSGM